MIHGLWLILEILGPIVLLIGTVVGIAIGDLDG